MISEAILIPKIYARLQKIASNFSKCFGGEPPDPSPALALSTLGSGLRPLTGPSLSKIPGSAPGISEYFTYNQVHVTHGHPYKLFVLRVVVNTRKL